MNTVGYLVVLRLPDSMSPEDARTDLITSIGFGRPEIRQLFIFPDPPPDPVIAELDRNPVIMETPDSELMRDLGWEPEQDSGPEPDGKPSA